MAGRQRNVTDIIMSGAPLKGQLYQTDVDNKLVPIDLTGVLDGWVLARNTTTGLWEPRSAGAASLTGVKFSLALPFYTAGDFYTIPMGRYGSIIKAWAASLSASGNATWTVSSAPSVTGSFTDMVGAGVGPSVVGALGVLDTNVTDWTDQLLAADEVIKVTCTVLSVAQATITLHFERT